MDADEPDGLRMTFNGAGKALRNRVWRSPEAESVQLHNVDYSFARNITGLRPVWMTFALSSLVGCWYAYIWDSGAILWAIVSTILAVGALAMATVLPAYVRKKAHYYAESFFGAVVALNASGGRMQSKPNAPADCGQTTQ